MSLLNRLLRRRTWNAAPLFTLNNLRLSRRNRNEAWIRSLCHDVAQSADTSLCRVLGRFKMFVDPRDYSVSAHLILDGYWEMWLTEAVVASTKAGMTAVDIGANVGYFSLIMADLVGRTGRVHAFEANVEVAEKARKSALINGFGDVLTVHAQALGDGNGDGFVLVVPPGQSGGAYLAQPGESGDPAQTVTTRRLDDYPELLDADVIKIDVEGAEEAVWRGMEGILARGRPMTIFLEFAPIRYADPGAFLDEIARWGFRIELVHMALGVVPATRDEIANAPSGEEQLLMLRR